MCHNPRAMSTTPPPSLEVEILFALIRHRYGARLDTAQLEDVRKVVEGLTRDLLALRAASVPDDAEPGQPFIPFRSEG
jgi:hypothetical protein